jgi:hypothetical protein
VRVSQAIVPLASRMHGMMGCQNLGPNIYALASHAQRFFELAWNTMVGRSRVDYARNLHKHAQLGMSSVTHYQCCMASATPTRLHTDLVITHYPV